MNVRECAFDKVSATPDAARTPPTAAAAPVVDPASIGSGMSSIMAATIERLKKMAKVPLRMSVTSQENEACPLMQISMPYALEMFHSNNLDV